MQRLQETSEHNSESDWLFEAWHWILEGEVATPLPVPEWFDYPAMMRITVSTPAVLGILKGYTNPFNFVLAPLPFRNSKAEKKSLIMPFSTHRDEWLSTHAIDTRSGKKYPIFLLNTLSTRVAGYQAISKREKESRKLEFEKLLGN